MRSSYGKEMEGASSDAKEIEGQSTSSRGVAIARMMKLFPTRLPCFTLNILPIHRPVPWRSSLSSANETVQQIECMDSLVVCPHES